MSKTGDVYQTTVQIDSLSLDILFNNILMYRSIRKHTHLERHCDMQILLPDFLQNIHKMRTADKI